MSLLVEPTSLNRGLWIPIGFETKIVINSFPFEMRVPRLYISGIELHLNRYYLHMVGNLQLRLEKSSLAMYMILKWGHSYLSHKPPCMSSAGLSTCWVDCLPYPSFFLHLSLFLFFYFWLPLVICSILMSSCSIQRNGSGSKWKPRTDTYSFSV